MDMQAAAPGDTFHMYACVPPQGEPCDVYLLGRAPDGSIWSILFNGKYQKGIVPYATGYVNSNYWCGLVHTHTVCTTAVRGEYTIGLVLMPAGEKFTLRNAIDFDMSTISMVKSR